MSLGFIAEYMPGTCRVHAAHVDESVSAPSQLLPLLSAPPQLLPLLAAMNMPALQDEMQARGQSLLKGGGSKIVRGRAVGGGRAVKEELVSVLTAFISTRFKVKLSHGCWHDGDFVVVTYVVLGPCRCPTRVAACHSLGSRLP